MPILWEFEHQNFGLTGAIMLYIYRIMTSIRENKNKTQLYVAAADIFAHFDSLEGHVLKYADINTILAANMESWRLPSSITARELIAFLLDRQVLDVYRFEFSARNEIRYVWRKATDYQIIQSLRPEGYFSHLTAMFLHGLTLLIPKTVYLNSEQSEKPAPAIPLNQERIAMAFSRPCRVSKTTTVFHEQNVCVLNGKYTGQKGVMDQQQPGGETLRVTTLERTLIDCTVRPVYSGGVQSVLDAYRAAHDAVSINKLAATLASLEYTYPYHQAIGFYLERAGVYSESQLALLDRFERVYDFYLTHQIKNPAYSERWKLFYPRGL
jgi:predicted transcriptional regulator of viral defense system